MFKSCWGIFFFLLFISTAEASPQSPVYHRDFWRPTYHINRLDYCFFGGKQCGKQVADQYCKLMGYESSDRQVIEYNVGCTNYIHTKFVCKQGWRCNGFKRIRCRNKLVHQPPAPYYYHLNKFVLPRYNQFRVAWCLKRNKLCGKPAAYSFCRRMGFMKTVGFKKETGVLATRTLEAEELCFGPSCNGFSEITCYR